MAKKQFETPSLTIEELTAELYLSKKDLKKANDMLLKMDVEVDFTLLTLGNAL